MINATVYVNHSGDVMGFETRGHAGYDDAGRDIVCAAVSMLVINTVNSLEQFTDAVLDVKSSGDEACISAMVLDNYSDEVAVLLKSLKLGLTQVASGNPDYITVREREV
jgi:uncharacterized protein YsxB (DUF464 family)